MEIKLLDVSYSNKITEVFNDSFAGEYIIEEQLVRQNIFGDENFDSEGCMGVFNQGRLSGFICCKYLKVAAGSDGLMPETGWISCIAVRRECQGKGIGSGLLSRGEAFLKSKGRTKIILSGDYLRIFGGIPDIEESKAFFINRGYELGRQYYDLINTGGIPTEGYTVNYDFVYREMQKADIPEVKSFLASCFQGKWGHMALNYIDRYPEMLQDVFIALDKGKVMGFARLFDRNSVFLGPALHWRKQAGPDCGGLGPLGIDKAYRGQNAGMTMLVEAVKMLQRRGVQPIVIDCTHLLDFYARLGFKPWKKYHSAEKSMN